MNPYNYIKDNGIDFERYEFGEVDGACMKFGESGYIGVRKGLSRLQEREVLAHEIGHFLTGTTNNMYFSKYDEKLADRSGANFLIPYERLAEEIGNCEGVCDTCYLAQVFGVSVEYMQDQVKRLFF